MWKQRDFSLNGFALEKGWMANDTYLWQFHFLYFRCKPVVKILKQLGVAQGASCLSGGKEQRSALAFGFSLLLSEGISPKAFFMLLTPARVGLPPGDLDEFHPPPPQRLLLLRG